MKLLTYKVTLSNKQTQQGKHCTLLRSKHILPLYVEGSLTLNYVIHPSPAEIANEQPRLEALQLIGS